MRSSVPNFGTNPCLPDLKAPSFLTCILSASLVPLFMERLALISGASYAPPTVKYLLVRGWWSSRTTINTSSPSSTVYNRPMPFPPLAVISRLLLWSFLAQTAILSISIIQISLSTTHLFSLLPLLGMVICNLPRFFTFSYVTSPIFCTLLLLTDSALWIHHFVLLRLAPYFQPFSALGQYASPSPPPLFFVLSVTLSAFGRGRQQQPPPWPFLYWPLPNPPSTSSCQNLSPTLQWWRPFCQRLRLVLKRLRRTERWDLWFLKLVAKLFYRLVKSLLPWYTPRHVELSPNFLGPVV